MVVQCLQAPTVTIQSSNWEKSSMYWIIKHHGFLSILKLLNYHQCVSISGYLWELELIGWTIPCEMWKNLEAFLGEFIYSIQFINLYPHLFWVFVFMPTFCNFSHRQCISLSHASLSFLYSSSHLWRDHTFLSLLELVPLRMCVENQAQMWS